MEQNFEALSRKSIAEAIENGMTLEDIRKVIFPHPSVSEILKEVAFK